MHQSRFHIYGIKKQSTYIVIQIEDRRYAQIFSMPARQLLNQKKILSCLSSDEINFIEMLAGERGQV